jgi:hypothetical protein
MIETVVAAERLDHPESVTITLAYDPAEPFAVIASFASSASEVCWYFARDLLRDGLASPAGLGDVRIFPHHGRRYIAIVLSTADWPDALFVLPRPPVAQFVLDVYHAVPDAHAAVLFDGMLEQELLTLDSETP